VDGCEGGKVLQLDELALGSEYEFVTLYRGDDQLACTDGLQILNYVAPHWFDVNFELR
jgi:hypothetical protein